MGGLLKVRGLLFRIECPAPSYRHGVYPEFAALSQHGQLDICNLHGQAFFIGIGNLPVRFGVPPEIVLIDVAA